MTVRKSDFENFEKTLAKLIAFTSTPIVDERDLSGVIRAFEFTFEQAWKSFQKLLQHEGMQCGTPRVALQGALMRGLIEAEDETIWLKMLEDRNLTSHVYQDALAREIGERIERNYIKAFVKAIEILRKEAN